jgi:hypothetical protein
MQNKQARLFASGSEEPALNGCDEAESGEETGSRRAAWIDRARRSLQESIPDVAAKLAEKAKEGSVAHMKLLLQLVGLEDGGFVVVEPGKREKTLEEILLEEWHKEP